MIVLNSAALVEFSQIVSLKLRYARFRLAFSPEGGSLVSLMLCTSAVWGWASG